MFVSESFLLMAVFLAFVVGVVTAVLLLGLAKGRPASRPSSDVHAQDTPSTIASSPRPLGDEEPSHRKSSQTVGATLGKAQVPEAVEATNGNHTNYPGSGLRADHVSPAAAALSRSESVASVKAQPVDVHFHEPSERWGTMSMGRIEITPEIRSALELMNNTNETIFVTGKAGTGKSRLLEHFRNTTAKRIVILAPTGLAAINVRGQTIHSFFGFPPKLLTPEDISYRKRGEIVRYLDAIVIDEVSMVRADIMDGIDRFLRLHREEPDRPFGGAQLILFGDPYQLPPIVSSKPEIEYFADHYSSPHFFSSGAFNLRALQACQLTRIFRQTDEAFIDALNAIRTGDQTTQHIDLINQRCDPSFQTNMSDGLFVLTATNDAAYTENERRLRELPGPDWHSEATVTGKFGNDRYPADLRLRLRTGAQVMFIRNDANDRWVNGTVGKVRDVSDDAVFVEVMRDGKYSGAIFPVQREAWDQIRYNYDPASRRIETEVVGTFVQYPLRLGWAITIHKAQGQTFDKTIVDFGPNTFAAGQAYVALSRCRTLDGMVLKRRLKSQDIKVDAHVKAFMSGIESSSWLPTNA